MASVKRLPRPVADVWDWQLRAACRDVDSSVFFFEENERGAVRAEREERAKAVCQQCVVRDECLAHALAAEEPYGVWGGLGEKERRELLDGSRKLRLAG